MDNQYQAAYHLNWLISHLCSAIEDIHKAEEYMTKDEIHLSQLEELEGILDIRASDIRTAIGRMYPSQV
jgi:hypothetical protein